MEPFNWYLLKPTFLCFQAKSVVYENEGRGNMVNFRNPYSSHKKGGLFTDLQL